MDCQKGVLYNLKETFCQASGETGLFANLGLRILYAQIGKKSGFSRSTPRNAETLLSPISRRMARSDWAAQIVSPVLWAGSNSSQKACSCKSRRLDYPGMRFFGPLAARPPGLGRVSFRNSNSGLRFAARPSGLGHRLPEFHIPGKSSFRRDFRKLHSWFFSD